MSKFPTRRRKTSPSYHSRNRALQLPTSSISRRTVSSSKSLSATVSQTDHPSPSGTTENLSRVIFFPRAISRTFIPPPTYPVGLTAVIYIYISPPPSFNILRRRRPDVCRGSRDRISDATFKSASPELACVCVRVCVCRPTGDSTNPIERSILLETCATPRGSSAVPFPNLISSVNLLFLLAEPLRLGETGTVKSDQPLPL